jgi:hypothetical protein
MLQSIKQLYGSKLGASDGEIGQIKDFYFDDQDWAVRYVVVDTGNWMMGWQVLISPHAFTNGLAVGKVMPVSLSRKQVGDSPMVETHKPISRQFEEEYHRYYGWPYYWEGDGLWGGTRGFPILAVPPNFTSSSPAPAPAPVTVTATATSAASSSAASAAIARRPIGADAHLRSTQAVAGYHLQATDGIIGHVCDFLIDDQSWAINQLVIKTGHRFTGKEVQIPMCQVERISYPESTVHVKLTQAAVEKSPEHRLVPNGPVMIAHPILAL